MPVTFDTATKNAAMVARRDVVAGGKLQLMAANDAVLLEYTLSATGGTIANGVWSIALESVIANGLEAAGTGTNATKAQILDSADTPRMTGLTVGLATGDPETEPDVRITNPNVAENQAVTLDGLKTVTHEADPS